MPGETNNDLFIKEKENNNMQNKWIKNHFIVAGGVIICLLLSLSLIHI